MKIAHISDLHFSKILLSPSQFLSKRWIGNLNVLVNRGKIHLNERPFELIPFLKQGHYSHIFISGDLSTTSHEKEFAFAKKYLQDLEKLGLKIFLIPGNHDCYLKKTERKKIFYQFFQDYFPENIAEIKKNRAMKIPLEKGLWLILLDTCTPCMVHLSQGLYSLKQDIHLRALLSTIPKEDKIIMMNHFPLFQYESERRSLKGAPLLQKTIQAFPNIILYLHGHTHKNIIAPLQQNAFPTLLDSGSLSHKNLSFFNSIEIMSHHMVIQAFRYHSKNLWEPFKTEKIKL